MQTARMRGDAPAAIDLFRSFLRSSPFTAACDALYKNGVQLFFTVPTACPGRPICRRNGHGKSTFTSRSPASGLGNGGNDARAARRLHRRAGRPLCGRPLSGSGRSGPTRQRVLLAGILRLRTVLLRAATFARFLRLVRRRSRRLAQPPLGAAPGLGTARRFTSGWRQLQRRLTRLRFALALRQRLILVFRGA